MTSQELAARLKGRLGKDGKKALLALLKGFNWEETAVLLLLCGLLGPTRAAFFGAEKRGSGILALVRP